MTHQKNLYSPAFREQALKKVYARGNRTVKSIALELNMNHYTLKNWMTTNKLFHPEKLRDSTQRPQDWPVADRLDALMKTYAMDQQALGAFCREQGIFPHHLKQWREDFATGSRTKADLSRLRELKTTCQSLERELRRKDKALAEAAALLVLQKKYQALWEEKGD